MGRLSRKEWTLIGPVLLSLGLWVFGGKIINATAVGLLAVSLMLALHVVPWKRHYALQQRTEHHGEPRYAGGHGQWLNPLRLY